MERIHLETIDSTNNYARKLLDEGELSAEITIVDADDQTAGRGQQGNSWETEAGKNLSFSLVCHPVWVRPAEQYVISECIALAVQGGIKDFLPPSEAEKVSVKWPNDIYYADKKISGTLIECDLVGKSVKNCIVGTGINVNQREFRSDAPNPVSLSQIVGNDTDRDKVLSAVVNRFLALYGLVRMGKSAEIHEEYKHNLYRNDGGYHTYSDASGTFSAKVIDVETNGRLILETTFGDMRRYEFKEVKFVL